MKVAIKERIDSVTINQISIKSQSNLIQIQNRENPIQQQGEIDATLDNAS